MRGLCGKKTQAWEMWPNGWPDWHHLWCTHADSSRKGSWPKKISGGVGVRGWGGGVGGSEIQKSEKAHVNTHMHIHLQRVVGQLGGGWGVGGQKFKSQRKSTCEHTYTHMHIHLQRVVGQIKISPV